MNQSSYPLYWFIRLSQYSLWGVSSLRSFKVKAYRRSFVIFWRVWEPQQFQRRAILIELLLLVLQPEFVCSHCTIHQNSVVINPHDNNMIWPVFNLFIYLWWRDGRNSPAYTPPINIHTHLCTTVPSTISVKFEFYNSTFLYLPSLPTIIFILTGFESDLWPLVALSSHFLSCLLSK